MNLTFRNATIKDLDLLRYWDTKQHVIDCDPEGDWNWAEELKRTPLWREQLIAEADGRPVGIVQIIDPREEEEHYWGDMPKGKRAIDIWIGEENDLGRGYGTKMMELALARCFQNAEVDEILIDPLESNTKAIRFYERLGFSFLEKRSFDGDICLIYHFTRSSWESRVKERH